MNTPMKTIDDLLTSSYLREAGGGSFSKGEEYFAEGAVHHLYCDGQNLTADVSGRHLYHTSIRVVNGELEDRCTCPMGQAGYFCKHLVAMGLTYLKKEKKERNKSSFHWSDFLQSCTREELIKIVLEMSPNNTDVIEKYRMANLPAAKASRLKELKNKIDEIYGLAEDIEEYYDEYDSFDDEGSEEDFIQQKALLVGVLEKLATMGEYPLLWDVSTYGLDKFFDISTAEYDTVQEFAGELMEFFLKTVHAGIKTKDEIFAVFTALEAKGNNFGYGILSDTLQKLPGDIKELWAANALEAWRGFPKAKWDKWGSHENTREYIERHLLDWAKEHQDNDLRLAIMEKRLRFSTNAIELAEEYRQQGMIEKIIPLLQTAYKQLDKPRNILGLLLEEYQKAGNAQQALDLAWQDYSEDLYSEYSLERLEKVAVHFKCWKEYYQKILEFLETLETQKSKVNSRRYYDSDSMRQLRLKVLFNHGDKDKAWELSKGAALSTDWWLKLAEWRSKAFPAEAAELIRKILARDIIPTGEEAYDIFVRHLTIYGKYLTMAGKKAEFEAYCANIRTEYKRRRLLLERMNQAKL